MVQIFDTGSAPPCPAPFNLAHYVLAAGRKTPEKTALITGSERYSFAEIESAVLGIGAGLLAAGLEPGQHVMLRLDNDVMFPLSFLGAISVGIVPVPTSSQLTEEECTVMARQADVAAVIAAPDLARPASLRTIPQSDLEQMARGPAADYALGDPERPAYMLFTSGTGRMPRAVVHAHRAIWARRMMWGPWYDLRASDRMLHAGAMNWSYTLGTGLMDPWACGATTVITKPGTATEALPQLAAESGATLFAAAPGIYRRLLRQPLPHLPQLRRGLSAGEKLPEPLRQRWQEATGTPLVEAYGMTECSTFLNSAPGASGSVRGLAPQPGRKVALLGDGEVAIDQAEQGLMLGYYEAGDIHLPLSGRYFHTGDLAATRDDGTLQLIGRADDLMNAGGYRVSPTEVEEVLARMPELDDIAVTAVQIRPDTSLIAAFYTASREIDRDALENFAQQHLARYKHPRIYTRLPALPRSANGKILRRVLRQEFEASHGQT